MKNILIKVADKISSSKENIIRYKELRNLYNSTDNTNFFKNIDFCRFLMVVKYFEEKDFL